ncbi:siderophore ABC transporter substrate-binding protein [Sagittula sp. SSi028]|uniref:siderophore ABC transporter substrate-binding protein n=1 Tax=Sagittula sp. SSi028 TaxID=3400636 RepID=UPI003AF9A840
MKPMFPAIAAMLVPTFLSAQTVSVDTFAGAADVPQNPQTVVALDLAAIDTLDAIGVSVAGVPDITPPAYLQDAVSAGEIAGTLFEPNFEAIAAMQPDVIIAGGRSQSQVEPLSRIAPTVDMTIGAEAGIVETAKARATAYGVMFDKQDAADAAIAELDAAIEAAQAAVTDADNALILMTNGGKVSAYGGESRFGWIYSTLNLPEAHADLDTNTHGEAVSFEFIAQTDPAWIFVIDRGAAIGQEGEAAATTLDNPLVAGTRAGQAGQIVYLDSAPLYLAGGGLQSMTGTLSEITAAMTDATN